VRSKDVCGHASALRTRSASLAGSASEGAGTTTSRLITAGSISSRSIQSAPQDLFRQRLFLHSFVTIANAGNRQIGAQLSREQFESMPHVVVSLTGRTSESYDSTLEEFGVKRKVAVITPHFLMVPLLIERSPELIAIAPLELARVFGRYGTIRSFETPVPLPQYALNQHWHPRFHHDPAIVWLRGLIKRTFEDYPNIVLDDRPADPRKV
jgi:DNA-binding transcriptional LysR family regulator